MFTTERDEHMLLLFKWFFDRLSLLYPYTSGFFVFFVVVINIIYIRYVIYIAYTGMNNERYFVNRN